MQAHVLQHVPFEGLGSIQGWLDRRRAAVSWTRFFEPAPALPAAAGLDLVIALGGPMSVNDEAGLPWLVDEKRFLREAAEAGVPVLGICLGAQMIASAFGAAVRPGREKEIGWFEVEAVAAPGAPPGAFAFPPSVLAFHWHGETFDLPAGATHLARSAACERQAFQLGANVIGLQFHLETTPESAALLVEHCGHELAPAAHVQPAGELLRAPAVAYAAVHRLMEQVLDHLVALPRTG